MRIVKLYICIVLVNIRNIYVKYSHCGPMHFKVKQKKTLPKAAKQKSKHL